MLFLRSGSRVVTVKELLVLTPGEVFERMTVATRLITG